MIGRNGLRDPPAAAAREGVLAKAGVAGDWAATILGYQRGQRP